MPYQIKEKKDNLFSVVNKDTGRVMSKGTTKGKAERQVEAIYANMKPEHRLRHRISLLHDRPMKPAHRNVVNLASHLLKQEEVYGNGFWRDFKSIIHGVSKIPFASEILGMIHPGIGIAFEGAKAISGDYDPDEGRNYGAMDSRGNRDRQEIGSMITRRRIALAKTERLKQAERRKAHKDTLEGIKDRYIDPKYAHLIGTKGFEHAEVRPTIYLGGALTPAEQASMEDDWKHDVEFAQKKSKRTGQPYEAPDRAKFEEEWIKKTLPNIQSLVRDKYPPPSEANVNYILDDVEYIAPPKADLWEKAQGVQVHEAYNKAKADYLKKKQIYFQKLYASRGLKLPDASDNSKLKLLKEIFDAPESSRPVMWEEYRDLYNYNNPYLSDAERAKFALTPSREWGWIYNRVKHQNPNYVLPESGMEKAEREDKEEEKQIQDRESEMEKFYESPDIATGLDDLVKRIGEKTQYDEVPAGELEPALRFPIMYNYDQNSRPMPLTEWLITSGVSGKEFSTKEFGNTYMNQKPYAFLDMPINGGRLGKIDYSKLAYSPF